MFSYLSLSFVPSREPNLPFNCLDDPFNLLARMPSHRSPDSLTSSSEFAVIILLLMPSQIHLFSITINFITLSISLLHVLLTDLIGAVASLQNVTFGGRLQPISNPNLIFCCSRSQVTGVVRPIFSGVVTVDCFLKSCVIN